MNIITTKAEIIGSHFINRFYNYLYEVTCQMAINNKTLNKEEIYKNIALTYIQKLNNLNDFVKEMDSIIIYFTSSIDFATMNKNDCVDFILIDFLPEDVKNQLTYEKKFNHCKTILVNVLKNYLEAMYQMKYIQLILNHRDKHEQFISKFQDMFFKYYIQEKDNYYQKYVNPDNKNKMISNDIFLKMQKEIKTLKLIKQDLENKNKKIIEGMKKIKHDIDYKISQFNQIETKNKDYKDQIQKLSSRINEVEQVNKDYIQKVENLTLENNTLLFKMKQINNKPIKNITPFVKKNINKKTENENTVDETGNESDESNKSVSNSLKGNIARIHANDSQKQLLKELEDMETQSNNSNNSNETDNNMSDSGSDKNIENEF